MQEIYSSKNYKPLSVFILVWMLMNIVQAALTGIDGDEAYYWVYSQHLQWGYFDHPPMVALSIKLGELFGHGYLFTRIGTVLLSSATIYFVFKALPDRLQNIRWYIPAFASVLIFHIYSFIVTPDAPLLFFTALFFYAYKLYLEEDRFSRTLFLAFTILGMIYSKYHGVLPVFFVFLSNPKLITKRSAWIVVALVSVGFLPHLLWQYHHDWPTVRYHLFERGQDKYKIEKTTNYILGQLLVFGPLTTIVALVFFFRKKINDVYFRAHVFTFFGVLLFFLFSSFKKNIEPHWTLTASISFLVLFMNVLLDAKEKLRKIFFWLMALNISLVIVARLFLILPGSPIKNIDRIKIHLYGKAWADSIYGHSNKAPLIFVDHYSHAALFSYYHPDRLSTAYSSVFKRKSNYDLKDQSALNNQTVYRVSQTKIADTDIEVKNAFLTEYLHRIDSFKAINGLKVELLEDLDKAKAGDKIKVSIRIMNTTNYSINANNLVLNYSFSKTKKELAFSPDIFLNEKEIPPGYSKDLQLELVAPSTPSKYRLIFSFRQQGFDPNFASPFYEIEVK